MNKILYLLIFFVALTSCTNSCHVQGSSNVTNSDGKVLYPKMLQDSDFKNIDSSEVVHGQFRFVGALDSARMANIFMDDKSMLTFVLEESDINTNINDTQQIVSDIPLNDELLKLFSEYNQLRNQQAELAHRHNQAIMNGNNMDVIDVQLNAETGSLSQREDHLVITFVAENSDSVLGPRVFFMMIIGNQCPELAPWIEGVTSKATNRFKNDPYVKDYCQRAQENEQTMNDLKDVPAAVSRSVLSGQQLPPPTPPANLAKPSERIEQKQTITMIIVIYGGTIANEDRAFEGSVLIQDDHIAPIIEGKKTPCGHHDKRVDAIGCFVLSDIIDEHAHFREPGLTAKADIDSESRAATYGGVAPLFDIPSTAPQTTSLGTPLAKHELGWQHSHVNYTFIFGATNQNADLIPALSLHRVSAIKLFMSASTGDMLVDRRETLKQTFRTYPFPIIAHCENSTLINANMQTYEQRLEERADISLYPIIRGEAACYKSTVLIVALTKGYGTRLYVTHLTTTEELAFFGSNDNTTAGAVIPHLMFYDDDYRTLRNLIKCNPATKIKTNREALGRVLTTEEIHTVMTDHVPHLLPDKQGGACTTASDMSIVQFSLPTVLELVDAGVFTIRRLVTLMCHRPTLLFGVNERGFLHENYKADVTIVKPNTPRTVTESVTQSKCKWNPMIGYTYQRKVMQTLRSGHLVYDDGAFDEDCRGEVLCFR